MLLSKLLLDSQWLTPSGHHLSKSLLSIHHCQHSPTYIPEHWCATNTFLMHALPGCSAQNTCNMTCLHKAVPTWANCSHLEHTWAHPKTMWKALALYSNKLISGLLCCKLAFLCRPFWTTWIATPLCKFEANLKPKWWSPPWGPHPWGPHPWGSHLWGSQSLGAQLSGYCVAEGHRSIVPKHIWKITLYNHWWALMQGHALNL